MRSVPRLARVRVVTMVAVTRLLWLDLARTLRVVAVVLIARLARCARSGRCSWRLASRNNYYISAAPQILFIYMAASLSAAGG